MEAKSTHGAGPAAKRRLAWLVILLFFVSGALVLVGLAFVYHAAQDPWRGGIGDRMDYHSALGDALPWLTSGGVALVAGMAVRVYEATGRMKTATLTLVVGLAVIVAASLYGLLRFNDEIGELRKPQQGVSQ